MGRRKKALHLLLWLAVVSAECQQTAAQPSKFHPLPPVSRKLSKSYRESDPYQTSAATGLPSNGETKPNKLHKSLPIVVPDEPDDKSRIGYQKDIMLVLPVKPSTNESDLQTLYTQRPITAIIDDRAVSIPERRADYDVYEDTKMAEDRHPYTNFLVKKMSSKPAKSPLDYGYPESFKFVEDLNGLPSNHKPQWASTDVTDLTSSSTTQLTTVSGSSTRNNPFEMFESVKPLEINKFLSPSMIASMPESDETAELKNTTESHVHSIPKRPAKPNKKPPRPKLTTEAPTTEFTQPDASSISSQASMDPEQVYAAVRYTTLLKQTNKEFLPNFSQKAKPISVPNSYQTLPTSTSTTTPAPTTTTTEAATTPRSSPTTVIAPTTTTTRKPTPSSTTTLRRVIITTTTTTTTPPPPPTTTTSTTAASPKITTSTTASSSLNDIAVYNVTEDVEDDPLISESFDPLQNFSDFKYQINHFEPPKDVDFFKPDNPSTQSEPSKELNPISSDMLTNDMKNMLVALGILKSDQITTTSTTEKPFVRREPVTPHYDLNSYTSFNRLPIDGKPDKGGISDDMKDLLASFGLLPKKKSENETVGNRISRQQNLTELSLDDLQIRTTDAFNLTAFESSSALNRSKDGDDFEADVADFFEQKPIADEKPASGDKPMTLNSEMFPDNMKNTLETLGFLKESSLHNRSPKSAHVFQPTSQLEKLNQDDAAKKITDVLRTIKSLSVKTEANNITAEELEKQLQNITSTLESDSFNEVKDTLLLDILSNDANLRLIESIDNMTSKFRPANKTWPVDQAESTTYKIQPKIKSTTTTEKVIQTIRPSDTGKLQPEMKPPNPLSTDELLQLYEMGKNEIKRQQPNLTSSSEGPEPPSSTITSSIDDTSIPGANTEIFTSNTDQPNILETSTTSTQSSSTTSTETSTDTKASSNNNAPISALVDSFGGGGVASEEPTADDLPTPKPNGLYFYLDWNTFLNVGEEDKRPIRIRFAPRAGNARNFIPITVP